MLGLHHSRRAHSSCTISVLYGAVEAIINAGLLHSPSHAHKCNNDFTFLLLIFSFLLCKLASSFVGISVFALLLLPSFFSCLLRVRQSAVIFFLLQINFQYSILFFLKPYRVVAERVRPIFGSVCV